MVSILINIMRHEQYFFLFRHTFLLSACSSQSHATSCLNGVEERRWRWLIFALHIFLLHDNMLGAFRSNHHCPWKFHKFHRKTPVLESLLFLKIMKLRKNICSAWISRTFAEIFSSSIEVTNVSKIQ